MSKKISLKQFLMQSGKFKKAEDCVETIRRGMVSVDNKKIDNPNHFFNPKSLIKIENEVIRKNKKLYFIMNKPSGLTCQKTEAEKNIYELIEKLNLPMEEKQSLFCVGRLDKETEGLLIITNDGKFADSILQSENEIKKEYHVGLKNEIRIEDFKKLREGIQIETEEGKYKTKPVEIKKIDTNNLVIKITEGKKRQIRRMFEALQNEVIYLKRVSIEDLNLGNVKKGEVKSIAREEILTKTHQ